MFVYCSSVMFQNFVLGNDCKIKLYLKEHFVLKMFGDVDVGVMQMGTMTCSNKLGQILTFTVV